MLDKLQSADFTPYLQQSFRIYPAASHAVEMELIQVLVPHYDYEEVSPGRPFSIIFRIPTGFPCLPQRIYTIEHESLGRLDLFLVPVGPDKAGMRYEAVFG